MAFPSTYNFSYYRGDTYQFVIRPKNANGTTFALDDYENVDFTIANVRGSAGVQTSATRLCHPAPFAFPVVGGQSR